MVDTQIWQLDAEKGETVIQDKTGKWCLTRFEEMKEKTKLQLKDDTML